MKGTIVLSPTYRKHDNQVDLVESEALDLASCSECGQPVKRQEVARRLGHKFVNFLSERAYGTFWDGMLAELKARGKV